MLTLYLADSAATHAFGLALGAILTSGMVLCLTGDLGTGKTALATAICEARGVEPTLVTSPSFSLLNIYEGDLEVKHFDLYRLNRIEELEDIGFSEYCGGEGLTLIEWGELYQQELPEEYLQVVIEREGSGRRFSLSAYGAQYDKLLEEVAHFANTGY